MLQAYPEKSTGCSWEEELKIKNEEFVNSHL
jgi:hypothetical protein